MPEKLFAWSRTSRYCGQGKLLQHRSPSFCVYTCNNRAGSPTGGGLRINRLTMEKIVALEAMPRPIDATIANARPGDFKNRRCIYANSCCQALITPPTRSIPLLVTEHVSS